MTEPARQLPGVKGQWILCSDCPPIEADGDQNGDVLIARSDHWGYVHWHKVKNCQYWQRRMHLDPRPFTLPAAPAPDITLPAVPAPEQTASTERLFVQIVRSDRHMYAVADDGTAWVSPVNELPGIWSWTQIEPLPSRDA